VAHQLVRAGAHQAGDLVAHTLRQRRSSRRCSSCGSGPGPIPAVTTCGTRAAVARAARPASCRRGRSRPAAGRTARAAAQRVGVERRSSGRAWCVVMGSVMGLSARRYQGSSRSTARTGRRRRSSASGAGRSVRSRPRARRRAPGSPARAGSRRRITWWLSSVLLSAGSMLAVSMPTSTHAAGRPGARRCRRKGRQIRVPAVHRHARVGAHQHARRQLADGVGQMRHSISGPQPMAWITRQGPR
jgi:hypothetical protein